MKTSTITALWGSVAVALVAGQASAGTLNPANVPAKAQVVGHVDLDALRSSKLALTFAKEILDSKREIDSQLKSQGVPLSADDILGASSITFWAEGDDAEKGAMIISGVDAAKFKRAIKKVPVHKSLGNGLHKVDDTFVGFTGSRMVVADDKSSVKATLKVLDGGGKSLAQTKKAKRLTQSGGVLVLAAFEEAIAKKIKKEADSAIFKNVSLKRGTMTLKESGGNLVARAVLETTDTAGADQLHKLAAGGISFLSVASDSPELGKLLDAVTIKTSGTSVVFQASLPINQLKDIAKALDK